jgi:hypothetical protein
MPSAKLRLVANPAGSFRRYGAEVLRIAFKPAADLIGLSGMVLGAILWAWHRFFPESFKNAAAIVGLSPDAAVSDLVWEIPIVLGFLVFVYRLVRAPFEIHQKQGLDVIALKTERDELKAALSRAQSNQPDSLASAFEKGFEKLAGSLQPGGQEQSVGGLVRLKLSADNEVLVGNMKRGAEYMTARVVAKIHRGFDSYASISVKADGIEIAKLPLGPGLTGFLEQSSEKIRIPLTGGLGIIYVEAIVSVRNKVVQRSEACPIAME